MPPLVTLTAPSLAPHRLPSPGPSTPARSRQMPQCHRLMHQEYTEGLIFIPHIIRLRRGYWAKCIVLMIHIAGNSIVATCHLQRLERNIVNMVLQRH